MEQNLNTGCCIVGGGPAGVMLGFLLARAGIDVTVLEKHADFFRDFRGDTIHPSTIEIMHELGLLDEFLAIPHQEYKQLAGMYNNEIINIGDFTHLPVARPVLGVMPQWDFLNFLAKKASAYPTFHLVTEANVTDLVYENDRVTGIRAQTPTGVLTVTAPLVVGTDGRHSTVRQQAGLKVIETGAPIDVLWFRLSKKATDPVYALGRFLNGQLMVLIGRGDYWQCAFVIEKGGIEHVKQKGLPFLKQEILKVSPFLEDRMDELKSWEDLKLLSVAIDHLETWYAAGVICIGDAAHAMSPVGGVGINLAIQDAVAAANILYSPLSQQIPVGTEVLHSIQQRREFPMRAIQKGQVFIQKGLIHSRREHKADRMPFIFRLLNLFPVLRRIPARIMGMGIRPEHVRTPEKITNSSPQ